MNAYDYINKPLVLQILLDLKKLGVGVEGLINDFILVDKFISMDGNKTERYKALSEQYGIHKNSVQRIVLKYVKQ